MEIDKNILDYYNKGNEKDRLVNVHQIEKIRTWDILTRYLPKPPVTVIDVGGGTGVYSFMLSEKGYKVHLLDGTQLHIEQANEINAKSDHKLESIQVGDARNLPFEDSIADVVLFLGPLYHLTIKNDRINSLKEVFRVLKPGGIVFSAGISKYASLFDGFGKKYILDEGFRKIVLDDLKTGQHRNPHNIDHYFTTAFFHDPNELLIEHIDAEFSDLEILSIEGPLHLLGSISDYLENDETLQIFLDFTRKIEKEMSLIGASSHLMVIARKP